MLCEDDFVCLKMGMCMNTIQITTIFLALILVIAGYFYAERSGKEIQEKNYKKAIPSAYMAFVFALFAVITFLVPYFV